MMSLPFDTQKMVDRLEHAGVTGEQARAHVEVLAEAMADRDERYANKQEVQQELNDIRATLVRLEAKLGIGLASLDSKIDKAVADLRSEMIRWVVSVGLLQTALISALLIKLAH